MIVSVIVVLNRTVVVSDCCFDNLCGVIIRVKVSRFMSVDGIKLWLLTLLVN